MSSSTHVRIELAPKAGFCIKSTTLTPAVLPPPPPTPLAAAKSKSNPNFLEPAPEPIPVPKGLKVFVNLAWDPNVPPPPEGSEDAIQRAMQGEDVDEANPSGWYVPIIVSNARQDKDKSGNSSLVFDCIFNSTVKSRTLRDPEFKIFLVELALQRIEAQTGLALSRNIGTPNIASKGKLLPRSVQIPASMVPALIGAPSPLSSSKHISTATPPSNSTSANTNTQTKTSGVTPLIQEISTSAAPNERAGTLTPKQLDTRASASASVSADSTSTTRSGSSKSMLPGLRGILKKPAESASASSSSMTNGPTTIAGQGRGQDIASTARLDWSWTKDDAGRLQIDVHVPGLTPTLVQESMLDIEPNRIILSVPNRPILDIDVALSDAEIVARVAAAYASSSPPSSQTTKTTKGQDQTDNDDRKEEETMRTLKLKRQRDFEVDSADAEWKVGTGTVSIFV